MKNIIAIIATCLLSTHVSFAQDIEIYHGLKGNTGIVRGSSVGVFEQRKFQQGQNVLIKIINPNPGLYKYEFLTKSKPIDNPEFPDLSELVAVLTGSFEKGGDKANNGRILAMEKSTGTWSKEYEDKITEFKKWLKSAEEIITESDIPESLDLAKNLSSTSGFNQAKIKLASNEIFKIKDIDAFVKDWQVKVKSSSAPYYYLPDPNKPQEALLMELYDNYLNTMAMRAKEIVKDFGTSVNSSIYHTVTVTDQEQTVYLKITAKGNKAKIRETGDSVLTIKITPYFKRPIIELVPVAVMTQSRKAQNFGIENGQITQSDGEDFSFGAGAVMNMNLLNWGVRNEMSWGMGLGFALVDQSLGNFYLSTNVNFGEWARLGVGYGFLRTPTGLKNGLEQGSDASEIENIADVIQYTREPALFITFVIPGLSLPISSK